MSPSHKECAPHDHKECAPQALIALSTLAYREYPIEEIEMYRNTVFGRDALNAAEFGRSSPMEKWYRSISSSAYPKDQKQLVFWKSTAKFRAENLFFRSVDTGRLVPLHLANFRLQWYADKRYCKQEEERGDAYRKAMTFMICGAVSYPFCTWFLPLIGCSCMVCSFFVACMIMGEVIYPFSSSTGLWTRLEP